MHQLQKSKLLSVPLEDAGPFATHASPAPFTAYGVDLPPFTAAIGTFRRPGGIQLVQGHHQCPGIPISGAITWSAVSDGTRFWGRPGNPGLRWAPVLEANTCT